MKTRYTRGSTEQLNSLNLGAGHLAIDTEKKALRLFDGATQGGFECVGQRAFTPKVGAGPLYLEAGTMDHGFFGEVATTDLINGDDLATTLGISSGVSQFSDEPWLKFALDGKILFVAKKTYRHSVLWEQLYQAGAVYGDDTVGANPLPATSPRIQDARITVGSWTYRVRLIKGVHTDPYDRNNGPDTEITHGSEWNRLMYHVHDGNHTSGANTMASEGITVGSFAQYSDEDLHVQYSFGNGTNSLCQEGSTYREHFRTVRGHYGVSYVGDGAGTIEHTYYGWRPVLELIQ